MRLRHPRSTFLMKCTMVTAHAHKVLTLSEYIGWQISINSVLIKTSLNDLSIITLILCDSWESHSACAFRWKVLNNREAGRGGNSTVVVLVAGHHNVAILPPALSPAAAKKKKKKKKKES